MPVFKITTPDGKTFKIKAPEGATKADALKRVKEQYQQSTIGKKTRSNVADSTNVLGDPLSNFNADRSTGAPAGMRAKVGLKVTPQGREQYLKSLPSVHDAKTRGDGELFYQESPNAQWKQFDEQGVTLRDFADMSGGAIETVPPLVAGITTGGNPVSVAAAQAGGSTLRHAISGLLGGDDGLSFGDRAVDVAGKTLLSGGIQKGTNAFMGKLYDPLRPHNIVAKQHGRAMQTPFAQESARLTKDTGVQFTPGQSTGSKGMLTVEGLTRRHPLSADKVADFDNDAAATLLRYFNQRAESISPVAGSLSTGHQIKSAFDGSLKSAVKNRQSQAKTDFNSFKNPDAPVFGLSNTVKEIDDLVAEFHTPIGGDTANKTVEGLMKVRADITGQAAKPSTGGTSLSPVGSPAQLALTPNQFQRTLQIWGNAARGKGSILSNLDDKATDRLINSRLFKALNKDLDEARSYIDDAAVLKTARTNYRTNSAAINEITESFLAPSIKNGLSPERLTEKFLVMRPSEARSVVNILNKHDPSATQSIKRYVLEDLMEKAHVAGSATAKGVVYSPGKFISRFNKQQPLLKELFSKGEYNEVLTVVNSMKRLADRANTDGSPTAVLMMAWELAKPFVTLNPVSMAKSVSATMAPRYLAKVMTTKEGRKALNTITTTSANTKARIAAAIYITSVGGFNDSLSSGKAQQ